MNHFQVIHPHMIDKQQHHQQYLNQSKSQQCVSACVCVCVCVCARADPALVFSVTADSVCVLLFDCQRNVWTQSCV